MLVNSNFGWFFQKKDTYCCRLRSCSCPWSKGNQTFCSRFRRSHTWDLPHDCKVSGILGQLRPIGWELWGRRKEVSWILSWDRPRRKLYLDNEWITHRKGGRWLRKWISFRRLFWINSNFLSCLQTNNAPWIQAPSLLYRSEYKFTRNDKQNPHFLLCWYQTCLRLWINFHLMGQVLQNC